MPPHPPLYPLPSSPALTTLDRFSLLPATFEDASGNVPLWALLRHLLTPSPPITTFPVLASLLDTLAVTLHGTAHPAGDYALLREAIAAHFPTTADDGEDGGERDETTPFLTAVWPRLVDLALSMPRLFPSGSLPVLADGTEVVLSREQAGCLVVHQFLRTVGVPEWKRGEEEGMWLHDFGAWYGRAGQRQESAVRAYLGGLMRYFERIGGGGLDKGDGGWEVRYQLRSVGEGEVRERLGGKMPLGEVEVEVVERYDLTPRSLGLPGGAAVVAANRFVGFGQSATQEEVHVGSSPEACPAVLLTPPLEDGQVLIVRGAQPMVNITGQRRDIRVEEMVVPEGGEAVWRERTMLFMDALELDMAEKGDVLPDLLPGNLDREIRKAYTAFSSDEFREIRTGLWGCGAFCGDPGTKMLVLWLAASLAETKLVVVCDPTGSSFAEEFRRVVSEGRASLRDAAGLHNLLHSAPASLARGKTLPWVMGQFDRRNERG